MSNAENGTAGGRAPQPDGAAMHDAAASCASEPSPKGETGTRDTEAPHDEAACEFVLIGDPVAHSLSPRMHNHLYRTLAAETPLFSTWSYTAVLCPDEEEAARRIALVRTGRYRGMNVTMPYKRLAAAAADSLDASAEVAGGANVLVREGFRLVGYNTDGAGAAGAVERAGHMDLRMREACVCGTGPTSLAIACALAEARAARVTLFSREPVKAERAAASLRAHLPHGNRCAVAGAGYADAARLVPGADVFVDATPRGMERGDAPIVDTALFHEGQVVLDVVYAHGTTALVGGARERGACAIDGLEMLVEQAALSVEIWARAMGLCVEVPREVMRRAALA